MNWKWKIRETRACYSLQKRYNRQPIADRGGSLVVKYLRDIRDPICQSSLVLSLFDLNLQWRIHCWRRLTEFSDDNIRLEDESTCSPLWCRPLRPLNPVGRKDFCDYIYFRQPSTTPEKLSPLFTRILLSSENKCEQSSHFADLTFWNRWVFRYHIPDLREKLAGQKNSFLGEQRRSQPCDYRVHHFFHKPREIFSLDHPSLSL